jgi:hypothetical protein
MLLTEKFEVLARSRDPENVYTGSPSLAPLPSGRLLASYEWFRPKPLKERVPDPTEVLVSDDDGVNWHKAASIDIIWASLFAIEDTVYLIGNKRASRDICISRSTDRGEKWSDIATLFEGRYHCAPTSVLVSGETVYRAFETCTGPRSDWRSLVLK